MFPWAACLGLLFSPQPCWVSVATRIFENSCPVTAHRGGRACRRQPALDAWLIHCSLSSRSPSCPGFPAWISDGGGDCMEVGGWGWPLKPAHLRCDWLVGIHLIFWVFYGARPHPLLRSSSPPAPPPLPAPAASQRSAVTVPRRISALHREERISAHHSAHLHTRSQRSTWALWAAPLLYKTWQSHHTDSTSSTLAAEGSSQDHSFSNWIIYLFFFFCDWRTLYPNLFSGTLWQCK